MRSIRPAPTPPFSISAFLACLDLLITLTGCVQAPRSGPGIHAVRINSTATQQLMPGAGYQIAAAPRTVDESSLVYAEAALLVKNALASRGLYEAPSSDTKAIVIEVDYGMASARPTRAAPPPATPPAPDATANANADITLLRSATRGPLEKNLVLTAREGRGNGDATPAVLWRIELSITDLSNDLRKYLPLLVTASVDQMGVESGGAQVVRIGENDKSVTLLRQPK